MAAAGGAGPANQSAHRQSVGAVSASRRTGAAKARTLHPSSGFRLSLGVFFVRLLGRRRRPPDEIGRRRLDQGGAETLLPIVDTTGHLALDVIHELIHLALHLF